MRRQRHQSHHRHVVIKHPRTLRKAPLPTRGLIMCAAGGIRNLAAPTAMARLLHGDFKLSWPLELYFTQDEADAEPRFAPVVANWTASMRVAGMVVKVHTLRSKGSRFECKLIALLETTLDEVLFCDSDVTLLRSPEELFDSKEYRQTGTLFFHDRQHYWKFSQHSSSFFSWLRGLNFTVPAQYANYRAVERKPTERGQPSRELVASNMWLGRSNMRVESGLFVFDRRRQERTLHIMRDNLAWLQTMVYGDKEVFWLAAELANSRYSLSPYAAGQMHGGSLTNGGPPCRGLILQFSPTTGEPLWVHGIKSQWGWSVLAKDETLTHTRPSRDVHAMWNVRPRQTRPKARCSSCGLLNMAWECSPQGTGNASLVPFSPGERALLRARTQLGVITLTTRKG